MLTDIWTRIRSLPAFLPGLACCVGIGLSGPSLAQDAGQLLTPSAMLIHPWQAPPPPDSSQAYFTNLKNEDTIETPFLLKFGLSGGWGLAPITKPTGGKSGHHHLLINRDLPLDFKKPLPFNEQYIHFGKGQMDTVLNLPPGKYTLRLLLADDKHLPHFVYSKPVSVTVTKKNDVDPKTLVKKGIVIATQGDSVRPPFSIQFHASGLNVGHMVQKEKDTGHFKLTMSPPGKGTPAEMDFVNGQTEVWLSPPAGDYTLRLEFIDNQNPSKGLVDPVNASIKVQ